MENGVDVINECGQWSASTQRPEQPAQKILFVLSLLFHISTPLIVEAIFYTVCSMPASTVASTVASTGLYPGLNQLFSHLFAPSQ